MSKKALLIGIDEYPSNALPCCVKDAKEMAALLERNDDNKRNFDCRVECNVGTARELKKMASELFLGEGDTALFYYSGHGAQDEWGAYLVPAKTTNTTASYFSFDDLLKMVNASKFRDKIVILDCCFAGAAGNISAISGTSGAIRIANGVTLMTACRSYETAACSNNGSVFTRLLLEGLRGSAADVLGRITTAGIYAYIDKALGAWEQRPMYKANVSRFNVIRQVHEAVEIEILREMACYFKSEDDFIELDPSFEWTNDPKVKHVRKQPYADPKKVELFKKLQKLSYNGLVVPVGASCMYDAAMQGQLCRLTELGKQYWRFAKKGSF